MKVKIVSASDSAYFHLLKGMILSLRDKAPKASVTVIDVGLDQDQLAWLEEQRVSPLQASMQFPPVPANDKDIPLSYAQRLRPHIPDVVGGADLYLWMDADLWLQDAQCLRVYLNAALKGNLAIVPEWHPTYSRPARFRPSAFHYFNALYGSFFDCPDPCPFADNPMLNSGMFACLATAPHWGCWARAQERILEKRNFFLAEQIALNYVLHSRDGGSGVTMLPARFNWICNRAVPLLDAGSGQFVEPAPPHEKLGVIHLTGPNFKNKKCQVAVSDGSRRVMSLKYRAGAY